MKIYLIAAIITLMFSSCIFDKPFWRIIKVDLSPNQSINTIQNVGDSTIFIGGAITKDGKFKINDPKAFLRISFDRGQTWTEKADFDCNTIESLDYNANVLLITGMKSEYKEVFYKYLLSRKEWQKLELPSNVEGSEVKIMNQNTYLFDITENQFGKTYLKTKDGGKTWSTLLVLMDNKRDMFEEMCIKGNKLWGIKTHFSNFEDSLHFQSLVSVDMNTREVVEEIPLGTSIQDKKGHIYISDIKAKDGELFILGQIKGTNTGYVWKVNTLMKKLEVQDSFKLSEKQITDNLFLFDDKIIVTYTDVSTFLPEETLLYKSLNEESWKKEAFPKLTYPSVSFNNGMLMGIAEGDKIYFRQF